MKEITDCSLSLDPKVAVLCSLKKTVPDTDLELAVNLLTAAKIYMAMLLENIVRPHF